MKFILNPAIGFFLLTLGSSSLMGQARLILNGAKINIANGAALVLENPAANAITRYDGHIISEAENNIIKWVIGSNAGNYVIPWGIGNSEFFPLSLSTSSAVGNGEFIFSTYRTGWQNSSSLPGGVTNVTGNGYDNSPFLLDRFWQINASNYLSRPMLSNLIFGYLDIEHTVPDNTIAENLLSAQRWNDEINAWDDMDPVGIADATNNLVTIPVISSSDLYKWWVLVDNNYPLPLTFLSFSLQRVNNNVKLLWSTTNEVDVVDFEIERSFNKVDFQSIGSVIANNSSGNNYYNFLDPSPYESKVYFRIRQKDANGSFKFSEIRAITIKKTDLFQLYPNPVVNGKIILNPVSIPAGLYTFSLYNLQGQLIFSKIYYLDKNLTEVSLPSFAENGKYVAIISNPTFFFSKKLIISRK